MIREITLIAIISITIIILKEGMIIKGILVIIIIVTDLITLIIDLLIRIGEIILIIRRLITQY
jgi:hypothetical protein